ncbi:hypothetical protein C8R43DRAFT_951858 [Mycena crocata]|nr:hypothetical protein C8R43DRAFT_965886 [Mycena crocata]KAJ7149900.1 hypothetical protein C8R43DRAFT_951858 [Mycena crocata]
MSQNSDVATAVPAAAAATSVVAAADKALAHVPDSVFSSQASDADSMSLMSYSFSTDEEDAPDVVPVPDVAPVVVPAPTYIRRSGPWVAGEIYGVVPTGPLILVPDNGEKWYAITKGRYVGCTPSVAIADSAVTCVSHALRTGYGSQQLAVAAFNDALAAPFLGLIQVIQVL